jgi:hypothetical protein
VAEKDLSTFPTMRPGIDLGGIEIIAQQEVAWLWSD